MNGLLPVLILALSTIVGILWITTRPGADPRQLVRDMVDLPTNALHDLAERVDREQLGQEAWSTLQRLSRTARADGRQLRAVRMNGATAASIRLAIGQRPGVDPPFSGHLGRLYGIDILVSPAVPDGVIIPIDVGRDRLDEIVAALDTLPRFTVGRDDRHEWSSSLPDHRTELDTLLAEMNARMSDDGVDPA